MDNYEVLRASFERPLFNVLYHNLFNSYFDSQFEQIIKLNLSSFI